eukprot:gene19364-21284_t
MYLKISPHQSIKLALLDQEQGESCYELVKRFGKHIPSRKKGLLSANDKKLRVTWAKENIGKSLTYWQDDVAFYLDGVGLAHKSNPAGEARAVSSMIWRRHDEGLKVTTKGRKEGSGGKVAKFFVAISHNKGVVMCYHHEWTVTGKNFFKLIREEFPKAFDKCGAGENNCTFLMDGCPKQNAALCRNTWESKNYRLPFLYLLPTALFLQIAKLHQCLITFSPYIFIQTNMNLRSLDFIFCKSIMAAEKVVADSL